MNAPRAFLTQGDAESCAVAGDPREAGVNLMNRDYGSKSAARQSWEQIVHRVLYKGYVIYPNWAPAGAFEGERCTFGRVYPRSHTEIQKGDPCNFRAECLFRTQDQAAELEVVLAFLQAAQRQVARPRGPLARPPFANDSEMEIVPMDCDQRNYQTRMDAVERKVSVRLGNFPWQATVPFSFAGSRSTEPVECGDGSVGFIVRNQQPVQGVLEVDVHSIGPSLFKLSASVANHSSLAAEDLRMSVDMLLGSFASTHFVFQLERGKFVSLLDPPAELKVVSDNCKNTGLWPVLVGDEIADGRSTMLASPIILHDYPNITSLDGAEIVEIPPARALTSAETINPAPHIISTNC